MLFFQKQPMMRRVLLAILPVYAYACWLYGLPLAILTAGVIPASII
ncbi:MAG: NADH:ubiquinone oxidoreductase, Na translocating, B subunit, partial [Spirochaetaceae bacterium]